MRAMSSTRRRFNHRYFVNPSHNFSTGDTRQENVSAVASRGHSSVQSDNGPSLPDNGEDTCGLRGITNNRDTDPVIELQHMSRDAIMERLNVNATVKPIDKRYISYNDRLRTFANWPADSKLRPERLSEAGFVYSGWLKNKNSAFGCKIAIN